MSRAFTITPAAPMPITVTVENLRLKIMQSHRSGNAAEWCMAVTLRLGPDTTRTAEGQSLTGLVNNAIYKLTGDGNTYDVDLMALRRFLEYRIRPLMKMQLAELYK